MLRFAAETTTQLNLSLTVSKSGTVALADAHFLLPGCVLTHFTQLDRICLAPHSFFSYFAVGNTVSITSFCYFEDAVAFPRTQQCCTALDYQNVKGKKERNGKKRLFFFLFNQIWWLHSACLLQKKNKRAHILHLHALCALPHFPCIAFFHFFSPLKLRITVWCLWSP